jgi:uncharacterized protein (DUF1697 family)
VATYIGLLRAVNVGGRKLKMPDLVRITEAAGGQDVGTYLQSGNVVFVATKKVAGSLAAELETFCGFDVPVLLRSAADLARVIGAMPYDAASADLHVTFLDHKPAAAAAASVDPDAGGRDTFSIVGAEVYLHCPGGYGRTKLNNTFWERKLRAVATTRNWRTVNALREMAQERA